MNSDSNSEETPEPEAAAVEGAVVSSTEEILSMTVNEMAIARLAEATDSIDNLILRCSSIRQLVRAKVDTRSPTSAPEDTR